jgi:hypothetical protein
MIWPSPEELEGLAADFQSCTLPKARWTHEAHLAVGTWHVHRYGPAAALEHLRAGIRKLNESHGTANSDTGGYHESITVAYVAVIAAYLEQARPASVAEGVQSLLASPLAAKDALFTYYSRDVLLSVRARREWVPPDRQPFSG